MTEEGFREIQLNGKQLVFLFMAATVVSVVIFLLGVLVGRDVRSDRRASPDSASAAIAPDPGAALPPQSATPTPLVPGAEPPAVPAEELSYPDRLQKNDTPRENLKASSPEPLPVAEPIPQARTPAPPAVTQPPTAETHPAAPSAGEPSGPGFAVQVAAYRDRREADTLVKRLTEKGYPAFVMAPVKGAPTSVFRVRVGKYKDRRDAEAVFHRLETEEQFKPWIAR